MTKRRFLLLVVLAAVLSVACVMFAACSKTAKHAITWTVDPQVTVKVADYDELPTELAEETVVNFTLEFANGYELGVMTGAKASGEGYTFTVGAKDMEIKITAIRSIASLEVTNSETTYYAGQTVNPETVSVKVNYVVGDPETVTGDKCIFAYQTGDAFSLGDTKYTVKYGRGSKDVTLDEAVVGLVKIDLAGGVITDDELLAAWAAKNYTDYNYDTKTTVITWTFDKAFEEELVLPTASQISKVINGSEFPFKNWDGVKDGKIAKDNAVSLEITAVYDPQLIDVHEIHITETIIDGKKAPALVVSGEWKAATEAYLYLYEGNDEIELIGPTVKKTTGSNAFELVFDIRELVTKTPKDFDPEATQENFLGKWMDIKFRSTFGEREETQDTNLENYTEDFLDQFVDLFEDIEFQIEGDETLYLAKFEVHTPDNTTERNLKLNVKTTTHTAFKATRAELEVKDEVPYLVISGVYREEVNAEAKAALKETLEKLISGENNDDCGVQRLGQFEGSWSYIVTTKTYEINDSDLSWKIYVSLTSAADEPGSYYVHFNGNNLAIKTTRATVTVGNMEYTLGNDKGTLGWTNNLVWVTVEDTTAPKLITSDVSLIEKDGKAYIVLSGTAKNMTKADLEKYVLDGENGGRQVLEFTVTLNEGAFTLSADLSSFTTEGTYWLHFGATEEPNNLTVGAIDAKNSSVKIGNTTYSLQIDPEWSTGGRQVVVATDAE